MSRAKIKIEKGLVIWTLLLGISLSLVGWYGGQFAKQFYIYKKLSAEVPATISTWGIDKLKEGQFVIYAKYSYALNEAKFTGATTFKKIIFTNQAAAKEHLEQWKADHWIAYYDPNQPAHSTLQRPFPLKILLHALIGIGVSIYFLYLRRYLAVFRAA